MKSFAFLSALLISLIWAPKAAAQGPYALTCKYKGNSDGTIYYYKTAEKAQKCKYGYDDYSCSPSKSGCTWDGSYKEAKATPAQKTTTQTAQTAAAPPPAQQQTYGLGMPGPSVNQDNPFSSENLSGVPPAIAAANPEEEEKKAKLKEELEKAKNESKVAAGKVEELKVTMEEIKVNNENNAILYRSPDANIGSVDPRFNAFNAAVSGDASSAATGRLGSKAAFGNGLLGSFGKGKNKPGRGLASTGSTEADAGAEGKADASGGSAATSDNPWVSYMSQTTKTALIDRLRKNPGLRDSLRERIAELQTKGDKSGVIELMEETLVAAEKESLEPSLDNLKPMTVSEAFSMDAGETEAQIRSLLADLDTASDPQFLPQESLFERVSVAHRRSLVRGSLKATH